MIKVYSRNMTPLGRLTNAFNVGYTIELNGLGSATFTLPLDDPKNALCTPFNFVELYDNGERVDLYRIMPKATEKSESTETITYNCEHVLATLIDDVIFGYFQRSNYTTRAVLTDVLAYQESTRWILGDCDFTRYFHYGAEHETVLSVLLSVPRPFDVAYQWTWDTTVFPWVLHLKAATDEISGEARWGKNIVGITKEEDPLPVATRIYPLGYGEGVNQLNIRAVNPTGLPYIQADTVADYGVINYIWVDRRYEDVDSLFSAAKIKLEELKRPLRSYTLDLVELKLLGDYSRYDVGKLVRIHDADIGVVDVRVMKYAKSDVGEQPWAVSLEIGNKRDNLAVSQTDLERRQQINDTYSQGSTNVDSYPYQDNCDAQHPAVIRFYLDEDLINVNTLDLTLETSNFRAYSRAIEGGGAVVSSTSAGGAVVKSTSSGGGSTQTSTSGGGTTASSSSGGGTSTSTSSGGGTSTSTSNGGGSTQTSAAGGDHKHTMFVRNNDVSGPPPLNMYEASNGSLVRLEAANQVLETWGSSGNHTHSVAVPTHSHNFTVPSHSHDFTVPNHTHNVTIPNHSHNVVIPAHTHEIDIPSHTHQITLPNHTHEIEHGIYTLNSMPTALEIRVDGNLVPHTELRADKLNLIPYLAKDSSGKVTRGTRHEVTIRPNGLARINAQIDARYFIQSRIGGTY
ncbi:phage minor structural protein [Alkalihalobacillus pseudalcaliphilus]|nr:phage tail spike protein [Alkalihalobacillus pseudalcaliphilus]KMK75463.1 phage minor structural protein [Alkalihalobacillus pseudalcaliphilus]